MRPVAGLDGTHKFLPVIEANGQMTRDRGWDAMGSNALVVSEDFVRRNRWAALLRSEGFETATCPGPFVTAACPRLDDDLCPLREWAHVAVVDVPEGIDTELHGGMPERVCTTLPDDRRTVFLYRSSLPSQWHHGRNNLRLPVADPRLVETVRAAARVVGPPAGDRPGGRG